jgi:hypothetical protein
MGGGFRATPGFARSQVSTVIDALDTLGSPCTERAASEPGGCGKVQRDRLAVERHLLEAETSYLRKER